MAMIVCNKCRQHAIYTMPFDYRGNQNFQRIDLCENCFDNFITWVNVSPEDESGQSHADSAEEQPQNEPVNSQLGSITDGEPKRKRGRPSKTKLG